VIGRELTNRQFIQLLIYIACRILCAATVIYVMITVPVLAGLTVLSVIGFRTAIQIYNWWVKR
jgi:hypothetical protein